MKTPEINNHPLNKAANLRLKKEGMAQAFHPDLPVLALARQVLIKEGQEETPEAFTLTSLERTAERTMETLEEAITPQEILTDDLEDVAGTILSELIQR